MVPREWRLHAHTFCMVIFRLIPTCRHQGRRFLFYDRGPGGGGGTKCEAKSVFRSIKTFYNSYSYILKDIMRGSVATERDDFCILIV